MQAMQEEYQDRDNRVCIHVKGLGIVAPMKKKVLRNEWQGKSWFNEIANVSDRDTRNGKNSCTDKCGAREEQRMLLHDGFKLYNNLPRGEK